MNLTMIKIQCLMSKKFSYRASYGDAQHTTRMDQALAYAHAMRGDSPHHGVGMLGAGQPIPTHSGVDVGTHPA